MINELHDISVKVVLRIHVEKANIMYKKAVLAQCVKIYCKGLSGGKKVEYLCKIIRNDRDTISEIINRIRSA